MTTPLLHIHISVSLIGEALVLAYENERVTVTAYKEARLMLNFDEAVVFELSDFTANGNTYRVDATYSTRKQDRVRWERLTNGCCSPIFSDPIEFQWTITATLTTAGTTTASTTSTTVITKKGKPDPLGVTTRRALLIGCQTHGLRGVNADVAAVDAFLAGRGFVRRVLIDTAATREGILASLRALIQDTNKGDIVVLYYSGHGGRIDNVQHLTDPDEPRTYACIIPFDHTAEQFRGIFSSELSALLAELTLKTRNITVVLDCCHAEEQVMGPFIPRAIVVPWNDALQAHRDWLVAQGYNLGARADYVESNPHVVRLAACKAAQVAYERVDDDGNAHGLLTEALLHVLTSMPDATPSWSAIEGLVRARVAALYPTQEPVVQGPVDRLLFDTTEAPHTDVLILSEQDGEHELAGGSLHGVTLHSRYLLMPLNANRADRELALAEAEVVEVFTDRARVVLELRTGAAPLQSGTRAFLFDPKRTRHPVSIEGLGEGLAAVFGTQVATSPRLCIADASTVPAMTIRKAADGSSLALHDRGGVLIHHPWPLSREAEPDPEVVRAVVAHAEQLARVYDLLDHPAAEGPTSLQPTPTLRWGRVGDVASVFLPSAGARLPVGDRIFVRVTSESPAPVYVSIIGVGVDRSIRLLSGSEPAGVALRPGESYTLGQDDLGQRFGLPLTWHPDVPLDTAQPVTLVAICTDLPVDLRSLESDAGSRERILRSVDELLDPEGKLVNKGAGGPTSLRTARYYRATLGLTLDPRPRTSSDANEAPLEPDMGVTVKAVDGPRPESDIAAAPRITPARALPIPMLFISAMPDGQQPLAHEIERRAIKEALNHAPVPIYVIRDQPAASRIDVIRELSKDPRPGVLHISCHGIKEDGLLLQDEYGNADAVPPKFLVDQVEQNPTVGLVTLSACDSVAHATAVAQAWQIDAIGVHGKIRQDYARAFFGLFYEMLARGLNVAAAFAHAIGAVPEAMQGQIVRAGAGFFPANPPEKPIVIPPPGKFPFIPSNIDFEGVDFDSLGDLDINALDTTLNTNEASRFAGTHFKLIEQEDGSLIAVYFARNVTIRPNASLILWGQNAGVVVAIESMKIFGKVDATPRNKGKSAGGSQNDGTSNADAGGPGGGATNTNTNAGGGGSYGGIGGKGAALPDGTVASPGKLYGNLEIVPLRGGSAGGGSQGGSGGGGIQLVAGKKLVVAASGRVSCGGGQGMTGGAAWNQQGHGGGSGGAILVEAWEVEIAGVLAANGGGAGAGHLGELWGQPGLASDQPALGSNPGDGGPVGASGSAGVQLNGEDGVLSDGKAGGGGGGAGRIRINTANGSAQITGTVSPSLGTTGATQGTIRRP